MAEEQDSGEKTEEPTGKRISQARQDGMVPKSQDLSVVLGMITAYMMLLFVGPQMWDDLVILLKGALDSDIAHETLSIALLRAKFIGLLKLILPELLLLMIVTAFIGAGSMAIQTKFLWSKKLLKPKFRQLNPITGIKRIFSINNSVNILKSLAKLAIIGPIGYFAFIDIFPELLGLMGVPISHLLPYTADVSQTIFRQIVTLLFILALFDVAWQQYSTKKKLKMSKTEVKEERKAIEGDEATRMKIRGKAIARARERMMAAVPEADVVVTNPTHLAIALKYDLETGGAPIVVAKGRGHIAERIKKIAREHNVPVLERKPLARALFKSVEIGQQIPYELYAAIAELFAYVYKLKHKNPFANQQPASAS